MEAKLAVSLQPAMPVAAFRQGGLCPKKQINLRRLAGVYRIGFVEAAAENGR